MHVDGWDGVVGFAVACAAAALLTPLVARLARVLGMIDSPRDRGLSARTTPLLGGVAILVAILLGCWFELRLDGQLKGILAGAILATTVGVIDDKWELSALSKLVGEIVAAVIPVQAGVSVDHVTIPLAGALDFGALGGPLTVFGIVAVMNIVNFSDGIDGLAGGVCSIGAAALSIIAFDLERNSAGVLAAIVSGAALGFLFWNLYPASVFMGDAGALCLGLMLACVAIQGSAKTNAVLALVLPLVVLSVPLIDTTFVVLKRMKYRKPVYSADKWHLHHRLSAIGFSQRKTVFYLYAWTLVQAGLALALRFVPYSDNGGTFSLGWSLVMVGLGLIALAASVYLVLTLEILKVNRDFWSRRPWATREEFEEHLATGEFAVADAPAEPVPPGGEPAPQPRRRTPAQPR